MVNINTKLDSLDIGDNSMNINLSYYKHVDGIFLQWMYLDIR